MMNVFAVDCKKLPSIQKPLALLQIWFEIFDVQHTPPSMFQRKTPSEHYRNNLLFCSCLFLFHAVSIMSDNLHWCTGFPDLNGGADQLLGVAWPAPSLQHL